MMNPFEFFCPGLRKKNRDLNEALVAAERRRVTAVEEREQARKIANEAIAERERSCKLFEQAKERHNAEIKLVQKDRERLMESLTEVTAYGETLGMHPKTLVSLQALEASAAARKRNLATRHALAAAMSACPDKQVAWYRMAEAALGMQLLNPAPDRKALPEGDHPFVPYNDNAR